MDINYQPKQAEVYDMYEYGRPRKIGYGGSRGGSKSHSADAIMLTRRFKYPGTSGLFVMKVYQDMLDIHIRPMLTKYSELEQHFNRQDMIISLPNGSFIRFLSGDRLEEFQKRKGREFADIVVDQSELFTQEEIEFLFTINRSTDLNITPKTLLCFNPGGQSHSYHKRIFIEKAYENRENPDDFGFIQAYGWDNAYWCQKQLLTEGLTIDDYHKWTDKKRFDYFILSDYGSILDQLPDNKRKAELLGDWDVFEGMFFGDFRRKHHVIQNYEFRPNLNKIGGLDYGRVTVLEYLERDYEGTICAADECYLPDLESPSERANAIADFLLERKLYNLNIIYDTDMDISQISNVGYDKRPIDIFRTVFRERMGDVAPYMSVVSKHPNLVDRNKTYRAIVNEAVKEYLHINKTTKTSNLYLSSKCPELIKCFANFIFDPNDPSGMDFFRGDNPKKDHAFDAFKYGFMEIYQPLKKIVSDLPSWAKKEGFGYDEEEDDEEGYELPHSVMGI